MKDMGAKGKQKRILLVSGIFFPDVGGPAIHVRKIADHLHSLGWRVTVLAFGDLKNSDETYRVLRISRKNPKVISWALYTATILRESASHDVVYAFDLTTAGIPAAFATKLFRKPFMLRIGGDPIWERIVEHGKRFLPMRAYYEQKLFLIDRPILFRLIRFVVQQATRVITYSDFLRDVYVTYYGAQENQISILRNPLLKREQSSRESDTFTFMFAGRFVSYKNLPLVIRAFTRLHAAHSEVRLLLIGDGPENSAVRSAAVSLGDAITIVPIVDQVRLFAYISGASVALAPALTEFNPNFILESLSHGKPAIISRDNGLSVPLPSAWQFDPLDEDSLLAAMEQFLIPGAYERALQTVQELPPSETWESLVVAHAELATTLLPSSTL